MHKILVIFFSLFATSAMVATAAPQDALLQERAVQNYALFEREVREIYEQSHHVTYQDFANVLDQSNVKERGDPIYQAWMPFVKACPDERLQRLVLSVSIKYLQDWATLPAKGIRPTNMEDIFKLLTNYISDKRVANLMWDPQNRTIWTLYFLMRWTQTIPQKENWQNQFTQKIVIIFKDLPQADFLNLLCIRGVEHQTLKEMSTYLYTWLTNTVFPGYDDNRPRPPLSLRAVKTILPYAAKLNEALGEVVPYGIMAGAIEKLYRIPEPRRLWTLDQLVALRTIIENIPFEEVSACIYNVERYAVSQEGVVSIFQRLRQEYTPERAARIAAEDAARRAGIAPVGVGGIPTVHSLAQETHDYADTDVKFSAAACAAERSTQVRLFDAIFRKVEERLGARSTIPFSEVRSALGKFSLAPAFQSVLEDPNDQRLMAIVYTFLKEFHPDRVNLWKTQFIRESEEAYRGRSNAASCVRGIRERILTGLRGIDPELDLTFAQVEGRHLMRARAATANPRAYPQALARQLLELGVRPTTPVAEAATRFKADFEEKLKIYGLEADTEFKDQAGMLAELIEGDLENANSTLSQELRKKFPTFLFKKAVERVKGDIRKRKKAAAAADARKTQQ